MSHSIRPPSSRELAEKLRELEPRVDFNGDALRTRIAASVEQLDADSPGGEAVEPATSSPAASASLREELPRIDHHPVLGKPRSSWRGSLRAAAGIGLFALGLAFGRATADGPRPGQLPHPIGELPGPIGAVTAAAVPATVAPERVALTIQNRGTDYLSSLALLSDMRAQLTPAERQQAREVAVAVLTGAVAELLLGSNEVDADALLRGLASEGQAARPRGGV